MILKQYLSLRRYLKVELFIFILEVVFFSKKLLKGSDQILLKTIQHFIIILIITIIIIIIIFNFYFMGAIENHHLPM